MGHGDEAVETGNRSEYSHTVTDALQLGHGDEAVETIQAPTVSTHRSTGFNWATAMKPWRPVRSVCASSAQDVRLQLGHGDEAVETPSDLRW